MRFLVPLSSRDIRTESNLTCTPGLSPPQNEIRPEKVGPCLVYASMSRSGVALAHFLCSSKRTVTRTKPNQLCTKHMRDIERTFKDGMVFICLRIRPSILRFSLCVKCSVSRFFPTSLFDSSRKNSSVSIRHFRSLISRSLGFCPMICSN